MRSSMLKSSVGIFLLYALPGDLSSPLRFGLNDLGGFMPLNIIMGSTTGAAAFEVLCAIVLSASGAGDFIG